MALFGPLLAVRQQLAGLLSFAPAFAYITEALDPKSKDNLRINQLEVGASEKVELAAGSFAIEQVYLSRMRPEGFFESHRKYIDVQVIVAGTEFMEVEDIGRLVVAESYNDERDFIKYADTMTASRLRMRSGDVAVFFPADGHMPCLQLDRPCLVRKTVVKVPVA